MTSLLATPLILASQALPPAATPPPPPQSTCDQPVFMVVAGETLDRARMGKYARAIATSKIYEKLGGYYVNNPRPVAVFEGDPAPNEVVLIVRFPCLANAKAFWNSKVYQEEILPIRLNPSAGDYIVSVYAETAMPEYMVGHVQQNQFTKDFSDHGVEQLEEEDQ